MKEVTFYGHQPDTGFWVFHDCAFDPQGRMRQLTAIDTDGIEPNPLIQGKPRLLDPQDALHPVATISQAPLIFHGLQHHMREFLGFDGWAALGIMASYAVAPELVTRFGGHPGLWFSGKICTGKSTLARWLMRIWGFGELTGLRAQNCSQRAFVNALRQYSCLPLWIDEYQNQGSGDHDYVLRACYDRSASFALREGLTTSSSPLSTPIITSEKTSKDAATRSRFLQVKLPQKSSVDRYVEMNQECPHYHQIGLWLMQNRVMYAQIALTRLQNIFSDPIYAHPSSNDRVRLNKAIAAACFEALVFSLGLPDLFAWSKRLVDFRHYLFIEHAA